MSLYGAPGGRPRDETETRYGAGDAKTRPFAAYVIRVPGTI